MKHRIRRRYVGMAVSTFLMLLLPLLSWAGYCWGGWLGSSAFIQQVFQCHCPASSEAIRYRPFQVVAPACSDPVLFGVSADTEWLLYKEHTGRERTLLVSLTSLQQHELLVPSDTYARFLSSTLFLIISDAIHPRFALYDLTTAQLMSLDSRDFWKQELTDAIIARMRQARMVYVAPRYIVVLSPTPATDATESFILDAGDIGWGRILRAQLDQAHIVYVRDPDWDRPSVQPDWIDTSDGQLRATRQGIVRTDTTALTQPIPAIWAASEPAWYANQWVLHDRAVLYQRYGTAIINDHVVTAIAPWLIVPQPLLLLPVPAQRSESP